MSHEISQETIDTIAKHINNRNNRNYNISVHTTNDNPETPQYFEIVPFTEIDYTEKGFYAVDGSYNSQPFYNGLAIGIYRGGYVCYRSGQKIRMNKDDDPIIFGQSYTPKNILITQESHKEAIYDELIEHVAVRSLIDFFEDHHSKVFVYSKEIILGGGLSTLLGFCQEILEWALVYEIACRDDIHPNDFILRDGTLRSLNINQKYLVKLGKFLAQEKGIILTAITKNSAIKMELNYTFRQIDNYLQDQLKKTYPFNSPNSSDQKIGCWFEIPDVVLDKAYGNSGGMFIKKALTGGRGIGIFHATRLDYVEKLQNYDWSIADINIFTAIPDIEKGKLTRDIESLNSIFKELTRLTQEHYILGYPYPLVEAHNFVTLKNDLKDVIINRVKQSMYQSQHMEHVDIENMFVDIHTRF